MPVPDDDLADVYPDQHQDPALARALRDLPMPSPAVPRWSPAEVRQRGVRRRNRRHAAWGGAGVIAAALVGVLIAGPLTPERGPTGAAGPQQVQAADPGASNRTPGPGSDGATPSASPSAARIDIGNLELTIYDDSGRPSGDMMDAVANDAAVDTLTGPTHLEVVGRYESKAFEVAATAGGSDLSLPWVVELATGNGQLLYVTSPAACPDQGCEDHLANQAVIGVFTQAGARKFYDSVEQGDAVDVVGYWGGGNSTVPPSSTPADASSAAKSRAGQPEARTSAPPDTVAG